MSAGTYDFNIEQGADYALDITYKDGAGAVVDLSDGYSATMHIRESSGSVSPLITSTNANSRVIFHASSSATPNIKLRLSSTETGNLNFGTAFYDLELSSGGSSAEKVIRGRVKLIKEFTK